MKQNKSYAIGRQKLAIQSIKVARNLLVNMLKIKCIFSFLKIKKCTIKRVYEN